MESENEQEKDVGQQNSGNLEITQEAAVVANQPQAEQNQQLTTPELEQLVQKLREKLEQLRLKEAL